MSRLKHMKKIASLILVFAMVLLLVSCTNKEKVPYGDIGNELYLTSGDAKITQKELYDALRKQSSNTLAGIIDEHLFAEEITLVGKLLSEVALEDADEADLSREDAITEFDKLVYDFLFNTHDLEVIRKFDDLRTQVSIGKFVDSMYLLDNNVNISTLKTDITAKVDAIMASTDEDFVANFYTIPHLLSNYKLRIAQRLHAIKQLALDVEDEDADEFIKPSQVIDYYKNNERNRQDVEAFIFSFKHEAEATAVLRDLSVKADGSGNWYNIPDLLDPATIAAIENGDTTHKHIIKLLTELSIPIGPSYTYKEAIAFYGNYKPSNTRPETDGEVDTKMGLAQVTAFFIEAYNLVNPTKKIETNTTDGFKYLNGDEVKTEYTYEDLGDFGSGIRSHIYDSLSLEEDGKSFSSLRSSGARRYLIIKLGEEEHTDLIHEDKDEDGKDQWIEDLTAEQEELIAGYKLEVIKNKLTSAYISKKVDKLHEDAKLEIFDTVVRSHYEDSYEYKGKAKSKDGSVVATINGAEITVDQLYKKMEKSFGINLALDLAINKVLLQTSDKVLTKNDHKEFESDFRDLMNSFSRDEFAQAGFPASVGREKFLMSIFGATSNKEAIQLGFEIPKLREKFVLDYESHYSNFYDKLAELTNLQYNNFKSVNVGHLLVYFDANGDGTPDNPEEYLSGLSLADRTLVEEGIVELMAGTVGDLDGVFEELANDPDFSDVKGGLGVLAGEINGAGRVALGNNTRSKWNRFARLGINVKFEEIGEITNTSNFITGSSTLDKVFYDRAMVLHDRLAPLYSEAKSNLNYLDFYQYNRLVDLEDDVDSPLTPPLTVADLDDIKSDFGFHIILVNGIGTKEHFDYDESDDNNGNYQLVLNKDTGDKKTINAYNENSEISASQIEYFIEGKTEDKGAALPTSVDKAFKKHFLPVFDKFNDSEFMQRELFFKNLNTTGIKVFDKAGVEISDDSRFDTIREINKRQFFDYLTNSDLTKFDANYDLLYGSWFDILEAE